ncbi:ABC transporter ATP-binding protein [Symbiobacterium terraclitae]|uniref:ABC transporter ATP-binding protein n=1 Tax=Symbiobacterium terraclitae TaxID=557451 RepID=UPI0035B50160
MTVIEVRGLRKVFRVYRKPESSWERLVATFRPRAAEVEAVKAIDLSVERGETLAFIGPNGAGKSTTIKMLTGILHPTGGTASVLGLIPWKERQRLAFRIGSVFGQKSQLWLHLPPVDTFNLLARIYELDEVNYRKRRAELVELFELEEIMYTPARKLSLGQRMRCEIAASLLHRPEILFLDEPTIGLDPVAKGAIRDLIRRANREEGVTVFLTSHDAGDIEQLCRRVVIINHGQVIHDGTVNALKRDYMKEREIDLRLGAPFAGELNLPGVRVLKAKGYGLKLAVDTSVAPIEATLGALLRECEVKDIAIAMPPMEQIIAAIYQGKGAVG